MLPVNYNSELFKDWDWLRPVSFFIILLLHIFGASPIVLIEFASRQMLRLNPVLFRVKGSWEILCWPAQTRPQSGQSYKPGPW